MALVLFGNGVADMRGSIGGTTFARNKAGAFARNRTAPVNPQTVKQQEARSRFTDALDKFSLLTDEQREGWYSIAHNTTRVNSLGQTYVPSGRQIFLEQANNMLLIGSAPLEDPPLNADLPPMPEVGLVFEMSTTGGPPPAWDTIEYTGGVATGGFEYVFRATPPRPSTKQNFVRALRYITHKATGATASLKTEYMAVFATAPAPDTSLVTWFISQLDTATGFRSAELRVDSVVVSA